MKSLVLFLLVTGIYAVSAQETVLRFPVNLHHKAVAFSIADGESGNFALLAKDGRTLYGFLFDENFEEIGAVEIKKLPAQYQTLTCSFKNSNEIHLLFGNQNRTKFGIASMDFEEKTGNFDKLNLRLRKEGFLVAISNPEKFSILSIPLDSDVIRLYELEKNSSPVVKEINLENQEFLNPNNRPVKMYEVFSENEDFLIPGVIKTDTPNTLTVSSRKIKIYEFENEIAISVDTNNFFTFIININPQNLAVRVNSVEKPQLKNRKTSNSLIFQDKLFQAVVSKESFAFQVYELENKNVLRSYEVQKGDNINFKNTPIIQHKDLSSAPEEIDTQKFLKKIDDRVGITAFKKDNLYHIGLGTPLGPSEDESANLDFVILNTTNSDFSEGFSATDFALSRTIEFTGLFDEDFEHVEGDIPSDFLQKIRAIARDREDIHTETVLNKNGELLWGFFSSNDSKYHFLKID